jgi:hypothetical protein
MSKTLHTVELEMLRNLISASHSLVENWESGDLAGAVNQLQRAAQLAEDEIDWHPQWPYGRIK